jgi:hypothetical protein
MPLPTDISPDAEATRFDFFGGHACPGCRRRVMWPLLLCWDCREQRREDLAASPWRLRKAAERAGE